MCRIGNLDECDVRGGRTEPEQWKGFDSVKLRRDFEGGQSVSNDQ